MQPSSADLHGICSQFVRINFISEFSLSHKIRRIFISTPTLISVSYDNILQSSTKHGFLFVNFHVYQKIQALPKKKLLNIWLHSYYSNIDCYSINRCSNESRSKLLLYTRIFSSSLLIGLMPWITSVSSYF